MITLDLPLPPSVNRLWRNGNGKTFRSKEYKLWISQADALFLQQKSRLPKMLCGRFTSILRLVPSSNRAMDCDNRIKAALDFCVRVGLIEDDKFHDGGWYGWVIPEAAPYGCRLTLLPSRRGQSVVKK